MLSVILFGSAADGKPFRLYSIVTFIVVVAGSVLTFMQVPAAEVNQAAIWLGLTERTNIYAYMLWVAVLAIVLHIGGLKLPA